MEVKPEDLERHRTALTGHCYRMLGSASDAADAVQDAMVRAWRALERFDGRSSLRTWLYRIATNVCLDLLADRKHRVLPVHDGPVGTIEDSLEALPRTHWLEPVPDALVLPSDADPSEILGLRQSIRLAFVAALQHLPPRQRAALLLTEVLGFSATDAASTLDMSVPALNSALQRARGTLANRDLDEARAPLTDDQRMLVDRFAEAFERYDMETLTSLLREDAVMSMPPFSLWLRGHAPITGWLLGRGVACRGSRLVRVEACGMPAFGQYKPGGPDGVFTPWSLVLVDVRGDRIASTTYFLDTETLFPLFGFPPVLAP